MREYWLTNENNQKWSLATSSKSPLVSVKNLSSSIKRTYWSGKRTFIKTNESDSMVSIQGTIWFIDGDFEASAFLRFVSKAENLVLWAKRDGLDERCCDVNFNLDSRNEKVGQAVSITVTFTRVSPWRGKSNSFYFSNSGSGSHVRIDFINKSDRESPFRLNLSVSSDGTVPTKVIVCDGELTGTDGNWTVPDGVNCLSTNQFDSDMHDIFIDTKEGSQSILVDSSDAYQGIDFSKDTFFQIKPTKKSIYVYVNGSETEWVLTGAIVFFDQFLEG